MSGLVKVGFVCGGCGRHVVDVVADHAPNCPRCAVCGRYGQQCENQHTPRTPHGERLTKRHELLIRGRGVRLPAVPIILTLAVLAFVLGVLVGGAVPR